MVNRNCANRNFHLRFAIYLLLSPADCRQNRNLTFLRQRSFQQLFTSNVLVVQENVDMLSKLSLFIHYAIAQPRMFEPQVVERCCNIGSSSINHDLALTIRKVSQETGNVEGDHCLVKVKFLQAPARDAYRSPGVPPSRTDR